MKLKNQFNLLAIFITAIPLACLLFVCINFYLRSQKNILLTGYEEVRALDSSNKGSVDVDVLKEFLKDRNACFRIESVNKLKMTYNEDTWYIETDGRGNFIKLWHNNYKVDRKGRRHISSDEYHEQKTEMAVSVLTAVHYIMDYQYNKMHYSSWSGFLTLLE